MSTPTLSTSEITTQQLPGLDVAGYVDLVLSDADTNTLVAQAIANARAGAWPDWEPREGQTELVLLELLAQIASELGYSLNQLPGYVVEVLLRLFGLSRDPGRPAQTTATITVTASPADVVVPAGTLLVLNPGLGITPVTFATDVDLLVPTGSTQGSVSATATTVGQDVNGTDAGTTLVVLSAVPYVDCAALASPVTSGTDPEDAAAFLTRGTPRFSRLTETLQLPQHYTAAALENPTVARAVTLNLFNGDNPAAGAPGTVPGHVTVAVAGGNGAPLTGLELDTLRSTLQAMSYVLLTVHALNATVTSLNISATVVAQPGYTPTEVQTNVATALAAYLSPDAWDFGGTVYANELVSLIDGVVGVSRVVTVTTPAGVGADYVLPGLAPLPRLGSATTTVVAG